MGIDLHAIAGEAEREFSIELPRVETMIVHLADQTRTDILASELFEWICESIIAQHGSVPADAWPRYCKCVAAILFVDVEEVRPESWLARDLGLS